MLYGNISRLIPTYIPSTVTGYRYRGQVVLRGLHLEAWRVPLLLVSYRPLAGHNCGEPAPECAVIE